MSHDYSETSQSIDRLSTPLPRLVATCFALAAFAIALLGGLVAGNETMLALVRALLALIVCYPVGRAVGLVCRRVISEHAASVWPAAQEHDATPPQDESIELGQETGAGVQTV